MKHSIDFLPQYIQRELQELVGLIREEVKDVVMVILYGSYAKNTYARHDVHKDYGGGLIEFNSDYDLFVVTKDDWGEAKERLKRIFGTNSPQASRSEKSLKSRSSAKAFQTE